MKVSEEATGRSPQIPENPLRLGSWNLEFGIGGPPDSRFHTPNSRESAQAWKLESGIWNLELAGHRIPDSILQIPENPLRLGSWNLEFGIWRATGFQIP
jgi:hypothetical protein